MPDTALGLRSGYFVVRLVKGGPLVPARIVRLCHCTPVGGDEQRPHDWTEDCDRFPGCVGEVAGEPADASLIWETRKAEIPAERYAHLMRVREWAIRHAPDLPEANPRQPIDLNKLRALF